MEEENKEKRVLKGVEIPEWYLKLEPKLLEQIDALETMERKLNTLRNIISDLMEEEKIDAIESDLASVSKTKESIVEQILKKSLGRSCLTYITSI